MKFKIKRTVFNSALSFVYKPILNVGDEMLPEYVKNIFMEVKSSKISFYGTNLDVLFVYSVNQKEDVLEVEEEGKCLLFSKTFFSMLKKYKGDDWVECELIENSNISEGKEEKEILHKLRIKYKKSDQFIGCEKEINYPAEKLKLKHSVSSFNIHSGDFINSASKVLFACGNNPERIALRNLCLKFKENKLYFVATSGPNLAVYKINSEFVQEESQFLIRKEAIFTDSKYFNKENYVSLSFGFNSKKNNVVEMEHKTDDGSWQVFAKPIDKPYPNWEKLYELRETSKTLVYLPKKDVYDIMDRLCMISPYACLIHFQNDNLTFSGNLNDKNPNLDYDFSESIDVSCLEKDIILCVNSTMFKDILKNINGEIVDVSRIDFGNESGCLQIVSKEDPNLVFFLNILQETEDD